MSDWTDVMIGGAAEAYQGPELTSPHMLILQEIFEKGSFLPPDRAFTLYTSNLTEWLRLDDSLQSQAFAKSLLNDLTSVRLKISSRSNLERILKGSSGQSDLFEHRFREHLECIEKGLQNNQPVEQSFSLINTALEGGDWRAVYLDPMMLMLHKGSEPTLDLASKP